MEFVALGRTHPSQALSPESLWVTWQSSSTQSKQRNEKPPEKHAYTTIDTETRLAEFRERLLRPLSLLKAEDHYHTDSGLLYLEEIQAQPMPR